MKTSNRVYTWIWLYLLGLTAIEIFLAYRHFFTPATMMVVLMLLSVAKAGMIMNWFMHLGNERLTLVLSLAPPLILVLSLLFGFFPDAWRLVELRAHSIRKSAITLLLGASPAWAQCSLCRLAVEQDASLGTAFNKGILLLLLPALLVFGGIFLVAIRSASRPPK